jgi:methionine synthase I (cobalamin-dependent)
MDSIRARFTKVLARFLVSYRSNPVRHVCGNVVNEAAERISNARLTLLEGGTDLVTLETDAYVDVQSAIKIVRPKETCGQALEVMLSVSAMHCGGGIRRLRH